MFLPIAVSFAITFSVMPIFIGYFQQKRYGQEIREEGPKWHNQKAGTPTMGGVVFLISAFVTAIITALLTREFTASLMLCLFILVLYGLLGFLDDFIKIFKHRNEGLNSKQKFIGQVIGAVVFYAVYHMMGLPETLDLPFMSIHLGWFYMLFVIFWLVGFSNAVNLTDGLDGLVTGLACISFGTYAIIAWEQKQYDVFIMCITIIGALIGFFPYNHKPAKIFMGDVGSLALGGLLAAISVLLHQEWTLLLIGFIYVIETLSVILQVTVFRATGKRLFKMSPIHHHFEMCGWSEWKVDIVFWSISLVMSILTLVILY